MIWSCGSPRVVVVEVLPGSGVWPRAALDPLAASAAGQAEDHAAPTIDASIGGAGKREAIRLATVDSTVALCFALLIYGAILVLAASAVRRRGRPVMARIKA